MFERMPSTMTKESKKLRILIVDDEPGWRDLLSLELYSENCEVKTATNAAEALDLLHKEAFDLVITDVRMPGELDGIDLVQTYRRENPSQKAIFITGYALEEKIEQALEQGAGSVLCLKKPFESPQLLTAIHSLLGA
jgi:CheY-like chemotaxis protein